MTMAVRPVVAIVMLAMTGCSLGDYETEAAKRLQAYRAAAELAPLLPEPTPLLEGRVTLRLPRQLATTVDEAAHASRRLPPFVTDFPGHVATYEMRVGTTKFPVSLAVGQVAGAPARAADVERRILQQVRADAELGAAKVDWQRGRTVPAVSGGETTWDVLEVDGPQKFEIDDGGLLNAKALPGRCRIWVSADPKQAVCTILTWRLPTEVANTLEVPLDELAALVARTVTIAAADGAAAPAATP